MSNEKGIPEFLSADNIADIRTSDSLAKFRSISLRTDNEDSHATQNVSYGKGIDTANFATMNAANPKSIDTIFQLVNSPSVSSSSSALSCPERPYCLMRTHFELDSDKMNASKDGKSKFDKIIEALNTCLNEFSEYDFTFYPTEDCMVLFLSFKFVNSI
jgi:CCR4-NOT transcriptional regulation complex NOT5 subunit